MKTRSQLENIKNFVDSTYNNFGNSLIVNKVPYDGVENTELGYCFKYLSDTKDYRYQVYKIVSGVTGIERTDFRVLLHEYGHIYLGHLDGIHEDLDANICNVLDNYRGELIDKINKSCGIDFADKLLERVIDDPVLNHSLHNIAMDMEVNSVILSKEDIEEMEYDVTSVLPKFEENLLLYYRDHTEDEEAKKKIDEKLNKMRNEAKVKLILPCRYHLDENTPFPDNLTYPEYLIMIIEHLDQFVKMMVSISQGGNGDTSDITSEDVQSALGQMGNSGGGSGQQDGQQGQGQSGSGSGMQGFDNLLEQMGMKDPADSGQGKDDQSSDKDGKGSGNGQKEEKDSPYKGLRGEKGNPGDKGTHRDHGSDSREDADNKRELGQVRSKGGLGCSESGKPDTTRLVSETDEIDMALDDVMLNYKSKVIKRDFRRDHMYLYNRGINRTVIAPVVKKKVTQSTEPTIVFLIDISGSMDTRLVDRILNTISRKVKKLNRGLKYNIITWSTCLGEHIQNIDPRKGVPRISCGGGTRMARGIEFFKENYGPEAVLILISDFEDYLEEWQNIEKTMPEYTMWGFNYGSVKYAQSRDFVNMRIRDFNNSYGY